MDNDDEISFFTRKTSNTKTGQARSLAPTIVRKHVQTVPTAGTSHVTKKPKQRGRVASTSSSSSPGHDSPVNNTSESSEGEEVVIMTGKEQRKKALAGLKSARVVKQNKPRSQSPVIVSNSKGKQRAVESEDEIDELASQPAGSNSKSGPVDLSSEPDFDLPPPLPAAKPDTQAKSWKPRARPRAEPSLTQIDGLPDFPPPAANGPPPIRSDGTFSASLSPDLHARYRSSRSRSIGDNNVGETSYINEFARYPAYMDEEEDFYIPPPLARATVPSYDFDAPDLGAEETYGSGGASTSNEVYQHEDLDSGVGMMENQQWESTNMANMEPLQETSGRKQNTTTSSPRAVGGKPSTSASARPASSQAKDVNGGSSKAARSSEPKGSPLSKQESNAASQEETLDMSISAGPKETKTSKFFPEGKKSKKGDKKDQNRDKVHSNVKAESEAGLKGETGRVSTGEGSDNRKEEKPPTQCRSDELVSASNRKGKGRAVSSDHMSELEPAKPPGESSKKRRAFDYQDPNDLNRPVNRSSTSVQDPKSASSKRVRTDTPQAVDKGKRKAEAQSSPIQQYDDMQQRSSGQKRRRVIQSEDLTADEEPTEACLVCKDVYPISLLAAHQTACIAEHTQPQHDANEKATPSASSAKKHSPPAQAESSRPGKQSIQPFRPTNPPIRPKESLANELFPPSPAQATINQRKTTSRVPAIADEDEEEAYQEMMRQEAGPSRLPASKPLTRSGKKAIQTRNKQNAQNVIELDDDDEDEPEVDSDIEQIQPVQAGPSRAVQPVQRVDKGKGRMREESPPIGSIFISKLPEDIKQGFYRALGFDEHGNVRAEEPDSEEEARSRPSKGAPLNRSWAGKLPQQRQGNYRASGRGKAWGARKSASKKRSTGKPRRR